MKDSLKKTSSLLLSALLTFTAAFAVMPAVTVNAEDSGSAKNGGAGDSPGSASDSESQSSITDSGKLKDDGSITWTLDSDGTLWITGTGDTPNYGYLNDFSPISALDDNSSIGNNIKKVIISDGITSIGDNLFADDNIESVSLPSGVKSIGEGAFAGCDRLTQINIPDTVTSIGDNAFDSCYSLTQINIPDTVTSIGEYAFAECHSLTQINIPDTVTSIGKGAFNGCYSLTQINIPDTVTSIGEYAFADCHSLTQINIPDTVTSIGDAAFGNCVSLTSIKIPSGVKRINPNTFIVDFEDMNKNHGVYQYNDSAYPKLSTIEIPANVKSIGDSAFNGCRNLKDVYYHGNRAGISIENKSNLNGCLVNATWHTIAIDRNSLELTVGGSTGKLTATVTVAPYNSDQVSNETVTWTSSDPSVATVDENGVVTAVSGGKAVITASAEDGRNYNTCEVTVTVPFSGGSSSASTESTATETSASDNTVVNATTPTESEIAGRNLVSTTVVESTINPDGTINDGGIKHNAEFVAKDVEKVNAAVEKQAAKKSKSSKKKATSVTIDMTDGASTPANLVPKEVLEAVKGENVNVTFDMGTYSWTVNGKDLANTAIKDINIGLMETPAKIPESTVNSIARKNAYSTISLKHYGEFGFKARLTINVGKQYKGKYANFYTVNDAGQALSGYAKVNRKGNVTVDFNHGGNYVITFTKKHAKA